MFTIIHASQELSKNNQQRFIAITDMYQCDQKLVETCRCSTEY